MAEKPTNEFVEVRNGAYYVRGTRIHLDILVYGLQRGETAESFLENYPSLGSLEKVRGALAFLREHPDAVEQYLQETEALWEKVKREYPMPKDLLERCERTRKELERRSA